MTRIAILAFVLFLILPSIGWTAEKVAEKKSDPAIEKRLVLARKMHEIRPAKDQINETIDRAVAMMPEDQRADMRDKMQKAIDYKTIEQTSIDAMAEIFTEAELQKMIAWYGSPEALAVAKKIPLYQQKIAPEIIKSLSTVVMPEAEKPEEKADVSEEEPKAEDDKPEAQ